MCSPGEPCVETLADHFSSPALSNCPFETLGILYSLTGLPDLVSANKDHPFLQHQDQALTIACRWLSFRRSPAQVEYVLTKRCDCSSKTPSSLPKAHDIGMNIFSKFSAEDYGLTPGRLLVQICTIPLCNLREETSKLLNLKMHKLILRRCWPYTSAQLLPHGPLDSVCGYLDWLEGEHIVAISKIMEAFSLLVGCVWTFAVPSIIKTQKFPNHFVDAINRWSEYMAGSAHGEDRRKYLLEAEHVLRLFSHLAYTMRLICSDGCDPTVAGLFLSERHEDIFVSCGRMIRVGSILSDARATSQSSIAKILLERNLTTVGQTIYNHFPESRSRIAPRIQDFHDIVMRLVLPTSIRNIEEWSTLTNVLVYQWARQQCAAPGCSNTTEDIARRFRYCSGCCLIPYCSRRCQKNAWTREKGVHHRDVCSSIRYIRMRHDLPRSSKLRTVMQRVPAFNQEDVVAMKLINTHFAALSLEALGNVSWSFESS
jgi:hypothetical protein